MGKYIDAFEYGEKFDAVIKDLHDLICSITALNDLHAVTGQEAKHGRWEQQTEPLGWQDVDCAVCSVCGESFIVDNAEMDIDDIREWWNYCPNCGAKMDEEEITKCEC